MKAKQNINLFKTLMNKKQKARIAAFITLIVMAYTGISFFIDVSGAAWPHLYIFAIAAWLHGIFWGYRYALEGRFTWL